MTGTGHVWRRGFGWAYCSRCGVVRHSSLETQCRGVADFALASETVPSEPHDGEQSPTSDEREIDRLRLEVSALKALADAREAEADHLRRLVTAAAAALDGLLTDVAAPGLPVHPLVVFHLRRLAHDLRAVLDQGAA